MKEIICCLDSTINTVHEIVYFIKENKIDVPSSVLCRLKEKECKTIFYDKESKSFFGWSDLPYNVVIKDIISSFRIYELIRINENVDIWYD